MSIPPMDPERLPDDLRNRLGLLTAKPALRKFPGVVTAVVNLVRDAYERRDLAHFAEVLDARIAAEHDAAWQDPRRQRAFIQGLMTAREMFNHPETDAVMRLEMARQRIGGGLLDALADEGEREAGEQARWRQLADDDSEAQADAAQQRAEFGEIIVSPGSHYSSTPDQFQARYPELHGRELRAQIFADLFGRPEPEPPELYDGEPQP